MKTTDPNYQDYVKIIFTISNIPDSLNDNDTILKNCIQAKFDEWLNSAKLSFAQKAIMRSKEVKNIAEGKSTREGMDEKGMIELLKEAENRNFTADEIVSLETDLIDEKINLLAKVALSEFDNILDRNRIRRLRAFLEAKKAVNQPKAVKTFTQFLINIPDDKKVEFVSMLRDEFTDEKTIGYRYMIEAMKELKIIKLNNVSQQVLIDSLGKCFRKDIGSRQAFFPSGFTQKSHILDMTINRINTILLNFQPE